MLTQYMQIHMGWILEAEGFQVRMWAIKGVWRANWLDTDAAHPEMTGDGMSPFAAIAIREALANFPSMNLKREFVSRAELLAGVRAGA